MEWTQLFTIALGAILVNNFIVAQFLGICPFMGVSKKIETASGMGLAVIFVMGLASAICWPINELILVPMGLTFMQTVTYILVIASLVQFIEMFLKKAMPSLYEALGVYLPLITTNCAVLGVVLQNTQNGYGFIESVVYGVTGGIGFLLQQNYGYNPPPHMREQLGYRVKEVSDHDHRELSVQEVLEVFEDNYVNNAAPLNVTAAHYTQNQDGSISANLTLRRGSRMIQCGAAGNGRLEAVANAIEQAAGMDFTLIHYSEHALDPDTDSRACSYVGLKWPDGRETWGCGTHTDIIVAGVRALVSAINNR